MNRTVTRPSISDAGMRIMRQLIGHPPQTMTELIEALNVTRTAVAEQLNELISVHYVEQTLVRGGGRGRPRYLFSATELAMRHLFEGNQDIVVPAMWRAIQKYFGDEAVERISHDVAAEIALRFTSQMSDRSHRSRMKEFADILNRSGRLADYRERKNAIEVCKLNCPFASMGDDTGTLCRIDRLCMQMIVGDGDLAPVHLVDNRHEGNHCCTFRLELHGKEKTDFRNVGLDI